MIFHAKGVLLKFIPDVRIDAGDKSAAKVKKEKDKENQSSSNREV